MPLYVVKFVLRDQGVVLQQYTLQSVAETPSLAKRAVETFIKSRDPRYLAAKKPILRFGGIGLMDDDDEIAERLLVLVGGISDGDGAMKPPQERYQPGMFLIYRSGEVADVAYLGRWLDATNWSGWRWHPQRKRWIVIKTAPAEDIVGEALQSARGRLRAYAEEAMRRPPQ